MINATHRKIVLNTYPNGMPKLSDFKVEENDIPLPGKNELLIKTLYIGLEPRLRLMMNPTTDENKAMRPHGAMTDIGRVMPGTILGEVVHTNNPKYKEGDIVDIPVDEYLRRLHIMKDGNYQLYTKSIEFLPVHITLDPYLVG